MFWRAPGAGLEVPCHKVPKGLLAGKLPRCTQMAIVQPVPLPRGPSLCLGVPRAPDSQAGAAAAASPLAAQPRSEPQSTCPEAEAMLSIGVNLAVSQETRPWAPLCNPDQNVASLQTALPAFEPIKIKLHFNLPKRRL